MIDDFNYSNGKQLTWKFLQRSSNEVDSVDVVLVDRFESMIVVAVVWL
jgi:hypothetical protein